MKKDNLRHSGRWCIAAFGIPATAWAVFYGYYAWCMLVFVPQWQALPPEQQFVEDGAWVGVVIGTLKEEGSLLVLGAAGVAAGANLAGRRPPDR